MQTPGNAKSQPKSQNGQLPVGFWGWLQEAFFVHLVSHEMECKWPTQGLARTAYRLPIKFSAAV